MTWVRATLRAWPALLLLAWLLFGCDPSEPMVPTPPPQVCESWPETERFCWAQWLECGDGAECRDRAQMCFNRFLGCECATLCYELVFSCEEPLFGDRFVEACERPARSCQDECEGQAS